MTGMFEKISRAASRATGSWQAFLTAILLVLGWACTGPMFGWSDTHSLFINTITTIFTFLLVFVIQGTQNRDGKAVQAKLDALIEAIDRADDRLIDLDEEDDERIDAARREIIQRKGRSPG